MTSAREPKEPEPDDEAQDRKKPGPKPERLVIDEKDAEAALDRLLGKKPEPKGDRE